MDEPRSNPKDHLPRRQERERQDRRPRSDLPPQAIADRSSARLSGASRLPAPVLRMRQGVFVYSRPSGPPQGCRLGRLLCLFDGDSRTASRVARNPACHQGVPPAHDCAARPVRPIGRHANADREQRRNDTREPAQASHGTPSITALRRGQPRARRWRSRSGLSAGQGARSSAHNRTGGPCGR